MRLRPAGAAGESDRASEHRRLPADDATLLEWLGALPGPVTVAMEATQYWAWLYDRLRAAGCAAVAGHPYVYIRRLANVDLKVLEKSVARSAAETKSRYPQPNETDRLCVDWSRSTSSFDSNPGGA